MSVGDALGAVAAWGARNARPVIAVAVTLAIAAAVLAARLPIDSGTETLVDPDGAANTATERVRAAFGEDPIVILAQGDLRQLLSAPDLYRMMNLEACLAGNVPEGARPLPGPCRELAELKPAQLVTGPATFLNQAAVGITGELSRRYTAVQRRAARAAERAERRARQSGAGQEQAAQAGQQASAAVTERFLAEALGLAARYGLSGIPSVSDPSFVSAVVFDPAKADGTPKARLGYLFPNSEAAQIIVRLRPDLSEAERRRAIELIEQAANETRPRRRCAAQSGGDPAPCFALEHGSYVVSGAPVVLDALAADLRQALIVLLAVAVILMALALTACFRSRPALLPLAVALGSAAITFGGLGLVGGRLSIGSIAVLPILIGLAVDYAIQLQARFDEAVEGGLSGERAAREAARLGAPTVATACLATIAGFAVLALSPTPMVRGFGLLLAAGVALAFLLSLVVGSAALSLRGPRVAAARGSRRLPAPAARALARLGAARERAAGGVGRFGTGVLRVGRAAPWRVVAVAVLLSGLGWVAGTRAETVSELTQLVSQRLDEVRDLKTLQEQTGVSGELDVIVSAPDLTDPETIAWISAFKRRVLEAGGYDPDRPDCSAAEICPGPSLTDFIAGAEEGVSRRRIRRLLSALPPYQLQGVAEVDPETGELGRSANLAFMIRLMPLDRQQRLIETIRAQVDPPDKGGGPPPGVEVAIGGLPVIAAEAADDLSGSRYWLALASVLAVGLVLLALYRSPRRVLIPLVPIVLATGWSSLMLAAMEVPLNPVSAVLGVMVVAIGTEFSVILASRFRQERRLGLGLGPALATTYARSGTAVLASGVTVITGFAALAASDIRMLRDFGLVTVVDLGVALAGVLLLLPAVLVLTERRRPTATVPSAPALEADEPA